MKLINKLQRYYFRFLMIFLISAPLFTFFLVRKIIYDNASERLKYQKEVIIEQIETDEIPKFKNFVEISKISKEIKVTDQFSDTTIYEVVEGRFVTYKQIKFSEIINDINYLITIRQPVNDSGQLLFTVVEGMLVIFFVQFVLLLIFNRRINNRLWRQFYRNLEKMKNYSLSYMQDINLEKTDIDEFNDLNNVTLKMAEQIKSDYNNLKEFTENASHEIHTPLAIIKSKIELLIQSEQLSEDQIKQLVDINNSASRLSRLNHSLMLLTKIENRQFKEEKQVNLKEVLEKLIDEFSELASIREIDIVKILQEDNFRQINPGLAETLIRNLISNAIRYCDSSGKIRIFLNKNEMSFSNSGKPLNTPYEKLFERFKKEVQQSDSLGLGLAIVKSICTIYDYKIEYEYKEKSHIFRIVF